MRRKAALWSIIASMLAPLLAAQIFINEVQSGNAATVIAPDGEDYADWIELHNPSGASVDLGGYCLSDKKSDPKRWAIPKGTRIRAKGYLVIWCDGLGKGLHAPFSLSEGGEKLWLSGPDGKAVDSAEFPFMPADASCGRKAAGGKKLVLLQRPTPGSANAPEAEMGIAPIPSFSPAGGFYGSETAVAISCAMPGAVVRYTLDGSEPTESSPVYSGPIKARRSERTTQKYGDGRKDHTGIQSYKYPAALWYPTDKYAGKREFGFVVKAKAFAKGCFPSASAASTYFIGMRKPSLPVISVSTAPKGFFDARLGIYVQGTNGSTTSFENQPLTANWNRDWERLAFFEYYDEKGERKLGRNVGLKVMGGVNRNFGMKSLNVHARKRFGEGGLDYPFFGKDGLSSYSSIVMRNSGNDWEGGNYARDAVIQSVLRGSVDLETQAYRPAVLYLNGEYWGLINIRERYDEDTLLGYYRRGGGDKPAKGVDIVEYDFKKGGFLASEGDVEFFDAMIAFLGANDLADQANFDLFDERYLDAGNAMTYMIAQLFCQNSDWPGNNMKLWRPRVEGGRFRFALYDTDFGYGLWGGGPDRDPFDNFERSQPLPKAFFAFLLRNKGFQADFAQRFAFMLNTVYDPARLDALLARVEGLIGNERDEYTNAEWARDSWPQYGSAGMSAWAKARVPNMRTFIAWQYGIKDWPELTVYYLRGSGRVELCGMPVPAGYRGSQCGGIPLRLEAVPAPGFEFAGWKSGNKTISKEAEFSLKMSKATEVEAVFVPAAR